MLDAGHVHSKGTIGVAQKLLEFVHLSLVKQLQLLQRSDHALLNLCKSEGTEQLMAGNILAKELEQKSTNLNSQQDRHVKQMTEKHREMLNVTQEKKTETGQEMRAHVSMCDMGQIHEKLPHSRQNKSGNRQKK